MKTIVLTGGGTLGHVFGCTAIIPKIKKFFDKIYYIGSDDGIEKKYLLKRKDITFIPIKTPKFVRKLTIKNLLLPFKLLKAIFECKKILKKIKPSIIFSKGGFVSVPVCLAANKQNIPLILHESDINLGLANKLIKNKAKAICTSFETLAEKLPNGIFCGSPIREELLSHNETLKKSFNIPKYAKVLLVIGGSLGAISLNELIFESLDFLCEKFFVIHLTGKEKKKMVKHKNYKQLEFCGHMEKLYSTADFAITRGGSNALFELLARKIPMLISPLKKQTRGEQILNAKYFEAKGYAVVLNEETKTELEKKMPILFEKEKVIKQNMDKYASKQTLDIITNLILKYQKYSWLFGTFVL